MLGLSGLVRLRGLLVVVAVAIPLALTGCDSDDGPTAAQAGQTLKNHILGVLNERTALDVTITDAGGKNVPCGDGMAKQTFAATGRDSAGDPSPEGLNALMVGALGRVADYRIVSADAPGKPVRAVNAGTRTTLVFQSPGNGLYAVAGETDCLPVS